MHLKDIWAAVARPSIRNERELAAYVVRTTVLCVAAAVLLDVVNQMAFFIDWTATLRSWAITVLVATVIAVPFLLAVGRANLELYRAKQVVEELSRTDPLTGLLNRRALLEFAESAAPETLALAIADIDRFKSVNDTHGHLVGDETIRVVARAMEAQLGVFGPVGRLGGEEFALLVSSVPMERLMERLWDFRDRIAATPIVASSTSLRTTVSVGVAARKEGQTFADLFAEADRALYFAKASGRNRVVSSDDLIASRAPCPAEEIDPGQRAFRGRS